MRSSFEVFSPSFLPWWWWCLRARPRRPARYPAQGSRRPTRRACVLTCKTSPSSRVDCVRGPTKHRPRADAIGRDPSGSRRKRRRCRWTPTRGLPRGDLGRREGLDPGGQHPLVAERIAEAAAALAVELVGEGVDDLGAGANGTLPRGIDVGPVGAQQRVELVVLGVLDHHHRVADQQLRVDERPVRHVVALAQFLGIERRLVEVDPGRAVAQRKPRRDRVEVLGHRR